jgi:hypothetical protein
MGRSRKKVEVMVKTFDECKNEKLWQWKKIEGKKYLVKVMDKAICEKCLNFKNCEAFIALKASEMAVSLMNKILKEKGGLRK